MTKPLMTGVEKWDGLFGFSQMEVRNGVALRKGQLQRERSRWTRNVASVYGDE